MERRLVSISREGRGIGRNAREQLSEPDRPLSKRTIVLGGVLVGVVGAVAIAALLYFYGGGTDQARIGLDVVRTAGTLVVGTGGAIALLLAARRQRSTELTLEHQREVAATAAQDAVERRITELYTRAVDQLGNDKAPVRLGGLHALERLATNDPDQQQTIVDVICAYLRMPYDLPDDNSPDEDAPVDARIRYDQQRQELQVRLTAQRILTAHLRTDSVTFWRNIDLDLIEAQLHKLDLRNCQIRAAQFNGAKFSGDTRFDDAQFIGDAWFSRAQFTGYAGFDGTQFSGHANFDRAQFFGKPQLAGSAGFDGAQFVGHARFDGAQFSGHARFREAKFSGDAWFGEEPLSRFALFGGAKFYGLAQFTRAQFFGNAWFSHAQFSMDGQFHLAQFSGHARFDNTQFSEGILFDSARVRPVEDSEKRVLLGGSDIWVLGVSVWPATWATREAGEGEEDGWLYLVQVEEQRQSLQQE
jgi:uncharacterized protein YjbI with pentapeptide repeats